VGSVAILSDGVEESQFAVADCRKYEEGFIAEGTEYTEFAEKWEKGNAGAAHNVKMSAEENCTPPEVLQRVLWIRTEN
jgi:hypothetical protein